MLAPSPPESSFMFLYQKKSLFWLFEKKKKFIEKKRKETWYFQFYSMLVKEDKWKTQQMWTKKERNSKTIFNQSPFSQHWIFARNLLKHQFYLKLIKFHFFNHQEINIFKEYQLYFNKRRLNLGKIVFIISSLLFSSLDNSRTFYLSFLGISLEHLQWKYLNRVWKLHLLLFQHFWGLKLKLAKNKIGIQQFQSF